MSRSVARRWARCVLIGALAMAAHTARAEGVRLPPFQRTTLPGGAEIVLLEKRDTPLVAMTAVLRGGALGDPAGKDGTAALYAELIQKGAGTRDAAGFAEAIEAAGGALGIAAGSESLTLAASFLTADTDLMLELAADALLRPRLAPTEFAKVRDLAVQSIAAAKDSDPSELIGDYGDAWLFRGHAYGRAVGGCERTLATIELEDLRRYQVEHLGGDRLIIAVVGDFDAATMRARLEAAFGGWKPAAAPLPQVPQTQRVAGRRVLLVDKPGATQTYFWLGNRGATRNDPARVPQGLVNTVFGGRYTSMLNTELRLKSGLSYGASSSFERGTQARAFSISSFTQTEKTAEAMDLALATLDRLHRDGLDAQTLLSAQRYTLGQFPPTIETNGQLAARLANLVFYGLGADDVDGFSARVEQTDLTAVRRAIDTSFPGSADLAIVMIGDATRIRELAAKYGPVTGIALSAPVFAP